MARKNKYSIDTSTIPEFIYEKGVPRKIDGVYFGYAPCALFCRCGEQFRADEKRGNVQLSYKGFECPKCGHKFTDTDVLYLSWSHQSSDVEYRDDGVHIITTEYYKHIDAETNIISIQERPPIHRMYGQPESDMSDRLIPMNSVKMLEFKPEILKEVLARYENVLTDQAKALFKIASERSLRISEHDTKVHVDGMFDFFAEVAYDYPHILDEVINEISSADINYLQRGITFAQYENAYPFYFRPLTAKVIRDTRMFASSTESYRRISKFPMQIASKEMDGLQLTLYYYMSGLISVHQFENIMKNKSVFKNPNYEKMFKSHYVVMDSFLENLVQDKADLETHDLNIRDYYTDTNLRYFVDYGYTQKQVEDAIDASNDNWLDFLINIGSTRRLKGAAKS